MNNRHAWTSCVNNRHAWTSCVNNGHAWTSGTTSIWLLTGLNLLIIKINVYLLYLTSKVFTQPAWDVSEMSQSNLHWERHLKNLSQTSQKRRIFCDVFKTSQIHLKKDVFFVTSLRRLKYTSKKMFILWLLWYVSKIYLESICDYLKISHKNGFVLIK